VVRRKLRVGVIFGGRSGEHEISLRSARSVIHAMDPKQYDIVPIGITQSGRWITSGDSLQMLESGLDKETAVPVALLAEPRHDALIELSLSEGGEPEQMLRANPIDVVFPVLHGPYGEDGTIQGLLELANIPYVGDGVLASALAMDKAVAKDVFRANGFPIVKHIMFKRKQWRRDPEALMDQAEAAIGYDCFVKPASLGSSVGITKAHNRDELNHALELAAEYDRKIIVEQAVDGREIEVAVLGNDEPLASIPGEIIPCREFYDYRAKYVEENSDLLIPAPIPHSLSHQIRKCAVDAYLALDCAGLARVDFLLERDSDRFYLNEVNTLPGFTSISMYPKLWEASGITYSELIDRLIDLAIERHGDKNRSRTSFELDSEPVSEFEPNAVVESQSS